MIKIIAYPSSQTDVLMKELELNEWPSQLLTAPIELDKAELVIIPNGSHYQKAINELKIWLPQLKKFLQDGGKILGLGLGLHLLGEGYAEPEFITGLALLEGLSYPLPAEVNYPVPAKRLEKLIGVSETSPLTQGLAEGEVYYDQTYYFDGELEDILALSQGSIKFPAIVANNNLIGVQFLPELSDPDGLAIIKNILALRAN